MIKKFFVTLLATAAFITSCKSDDDDNKELSVEQRNSLDDIAIEEYLEQHYFNPTSGKLVKFDKIEGNEDDQYTKLIDLAIKDPAGYYYGMRPGVVADSASVVSNDASEILISYEAQIFKATTDTATYKNHYGLLTGYDNTINVGDGSGKKDPSFYYYKLTDALLEKGVKREYIELANFTEALKKFKSTGTNGTDLYNFQGFIILPSRLAYGRNKMFDGTKVTDQHGFRETSFIFNFELHKVKPRQ